MSTAYAFVDESGSTSPFSGSRFLVIALDIIGNKRVVVEDVLKRRLW